MSYLSRVIDKIAAVSFPPEEEEATIGVNRFPELQVVTLTPAVYANLERQLPAPHVTSDPTEAAIQVGVQIVLRKLRDGFVA